MIRPVAIALGVIVYGQFTSKTTAPSSQHRSKVATRQRPGTNRRGRSSLAPWSSAWRPSSALRREPRFHAAAHIQAAPFASKVPFAKIFRL